VAPVCRREFWGSSFPKIAGAEIRKSESKIVLELEEVDLVDLEVVGFFG
jgi:hypothetical protein